MTSRIAYVGMAAVCAVLAASQPAKAANPEASTQAPPKEDPCTPVPRSVVWKDGNSWEKYHQRYLERVKNGPAEIVFYGDSITEWWPWQDFKARYGAAGAVNFGIGGDRTQHLLWRIQNGELDGLHPKLAIVMIGTNNLGGDPADRIAQGITLIVEEIRNRSPETKVLLLGIFPRGRDAKEFLRPKIRKVNDQIAKLDDGKMVRYADLGQVLLESDGALTPETSKDGLHLTARGYARWASVLDPMIEEMVGVRLPAP